MITVRVARNAMGSRFEVVLRGDDEVHLRAAGEEALGEIERWDARLSTYKPTSEVSIINATAAQGPVLVDPVLFALLQRIRGLHEATRGAFDPTVGPLMETWNFVRGTGTVPSRERIDAALSVSGMHRVHLDPERRTIQFERQGMRLDLGAIGKGFALEEAVNLLREAGVKHALIHGGNSTVCALGHPDDIGNWNVAIPYPESHGRQADPDRMLAVVPLNETALSVSAVWSRSFEVDGRVFGHVMDPRTGWPVSRAVLSAVVMSSATDADALSTALLVLGNDGLSIIQERWPDGKTLVAVPDDSEAGFHCSTDGITLE